MVQVMQVTDNTEPRSMRQRNMEETLMMYTHIFQIYILN